MHEATSSMLSCCQIARRPATLDAAGAAAFTRQVISEEYGFTMTIAAANSSSRHHGRLARAKDGQPLSARTWRPPTWLRRWHFGRFNARSRGDRRAAGKHYCCHDDSAAMRVIDTPRLRCRADGQPRHGISTIVGRHLFRAAAAKQVIRRARPIFSVMQARHSLPSLSHTPALTAGPM